MAGWRVGSLAALALWAGCADPPARGPSGDGNDAAATERRCLAPPGVSGAPGSIAAAVRLANALPHPLSLPCFLESLDRPLDAHAATSIISLQPSAGERSPRIFLFSGNLIMSVVPEGKGRSLVELGQLVAPGRSLKAELRFPMEGPLGPEDPFEHVREGEGTTCRFCHPTEERAPEIAGPAYVSGAFSPLPRARVTLESLASERARCNDAQEPDRCAFLGALFDHGEVRWRDFPLSVPTAFGPQ
jgi:hypothetical protein